MKKRLLIGVFWAIILPLNLSAQASVRAELSSTRIMIGDQVNLQIRVSQTGAAQVDIDLQPLADTKGLEVVNESAPIRKEDPGMEYLEKNITITSFDSGEYVVPPLTVSLLQTGGQVVELHTNPIPLSVLTVPIVSDSIQLAPIKDIEREKFTFRDGLPYLLGAAGLAIIAFLIWWFFVKKPAVAGKMAPVVIRPPHEVALEKLDLLQKQQLWQQSKIKDYYSQLTYIAREYLEHRYRIPALENTTGEILQKIRTLPEIDQPLLDQLRRILTSSDMVKFAKAEPAATFHTEALEQTRQFIIITKPKPQLVSADDLEKEEPQELEKAKEE